MRIVIAALVCLLLASCGTKFAYRNMDWFILEYVDDFVDLSSDQNDILTLQIDKLSDWHRVEELPLYVENLDSLLAISPETITQKEVAQQFHQIERHYERLIARVAPDLYAFTQTLTDEQVKQLLESISERHGKYREKYKDLSEKEIHERYQERIEEKVEKWIGRLTSEQRKVIENWGSEFEISAFEWMSYQDTMYKEWETSLYRREDPSYFQLKFQQLIFNSDSFFSSELTAMITHNRSVSEKHIVDIAQSMSEKQWKHFRSEINDWKEIALELQQ
ncbi:DUF6279 family lipoprotein [Vibrio sp. 10N.261.55.A7]|uniref:DUF6279 family lipoprotein n=1 Tax=Vibrio sp. 10N.261.55.A7 TaxID=1880851 RepID=UPI000C85A551|nr:DUF6279 family lipoprotein [Vibrio sp. 10N.261.55.A7]PMJ99882.1 hypothetical protein BCU12_03340 [Vibrio sp. 10N.261.55.A7]